MTLQKNLKQLVRQRMAETGQRYAAARRAVLQTNGTSKSPHRPGSVPGATALRVLLAHAGRELSEAMLFGLAGGIGIGACSFFYEKADVATFFVASRHRWFDDVGYVTEACRRVGIKPVVAESSSPKAAEKKLREVLAAHGPCIAWVDLAGLPHRGLPETWSGGGYHLITIYSADERSALIGDLTDEPVEIAMTDLTKARGRIKKDKHRLLAVDSVNASTKLVDQVQSALKACHAGLNGAGAPKAWTKNMSLAALQTWADRLTSPKDKDRWERVFAPGKRFWNGLKSIHLFAEYYGTGGGLSRPMMADFLTGAGDAIKQPALKTLGKHYAVLGEQWTALADAALPDSVPSLAETKKQLALYAEQFHSGGSADEQRACWSRLAQLEEQAAKKFPLTPDECAELRADLSERVRDLHAAELAAQEQLLNLA